MAKDDYTKEDGGLNKDGSRPNYRMPIIKDTERAPHYKMRMPDKSTMRKKQRETKRTLVKS